MTLELKSRFLNHDVRGSTFEFNSSVFSQFCKKSLASPRLKCPIIPCSESSESSQEQSSEASGDSFVSASEDFLPYDENVEPIAKEQEATEYQ